MAINTAELLTRLGKVFGWADEIITAKPADAAQRLEHVGAVSRDMLITTIDKDGVGLPEMTEKAALTELVAEMEGSDTVLETTVSAVVGAVAGTGNGTVVIDVSDLDGNNWMHAFNEKLVFECINDSQSSSRPSADSERWSVRGVARLDPLDPLWPGGSGAHQSNLRAADPTFHNGRFLGQNILTNSDMEVFKKTANLPDNWESLPSLGTPGVQYKKTTTKYAGANAFEFIGDAGGTLSNIKQRFGQAVGTAARILARQKYCLSMQARDDGTIPTTGIASLALRDDDTPTTIVGGSELTVDLNAVGSAYALTTKTFATPASLPTNIRTDFRQSTALEDGRSAYFDHLTLSTMFQLYSGGPYACIIPGSIPFVKGDTITVTLTNNNEGKFVRHFHRFFRTDLHGIQLPASGSPSISDALVA